MAAGLDALDDQRVGAGRVRRLRLGERAALVQPDIRRPPPRLAPEGDDGVGLRGRVEPIRLGERQQQVDRERLAGQRPRRRQLAADLVGAEHRDRAQTTRLGDRCGELVAAEAAAQPGLHHRDCDAESLENRHGLHAAAGLRQRSVRDHPPVLKVDDGRDTFVVAVVVNKRDARRLRCSRQQQVGG